MLSFTNEGAASDKRIQEIKSNPALFNEEISSRGLKIDDVTLGNINKSKSVANENLRELFKTHSKLKGLARKSAGWDFT